MRTAASHQPLRRTTLRCRRVTNAALVIGIVAGLVGAAACAVETKGDPDTITIAVPNSPNNLDPRVGTDDVSARVHQLIFNNLLTLDEHLRVGPGLATGWDTPDDRTYVVHLRRGVRFHDGHELTAADVVYTFNSLLDPNFVSPKKGAYRSLESATARDAYTVEFKLKEPFGSFPINLVLAIVPAGAGRELRDRPVGTGPYQFVRYAVDDTLVLKSFPDYFEGAPRNDGLTLKVVPDDIMRGLELRKGSIDLVINDIAPDIVHQLEDEHHLRIVRSPGTDYAYLGFNLRDPILRDLRVRQAIGYAIEREAIVEYLRRGLATPAVGVLPPVSWAFEPNVFQFSYDPSRATRLLDEAGYPDPDGDGPLPRFSLTLKVSNTEFNRLQSAVIQQDFNHVGIRLDVRSYEFATFYTDVLRGNFQLFTLQWVGVSDPDMLRRVFHSKQVPPVGFNRGYFSDPEVDRLVDQATTSTDDGERQRLYARVQQLVAKAAPYISLWYKTNVAVAQPDLEGIRLLPAADFTFLKDVHRTARQTMDVPRAPRPK